VSRVVHPGEVLHDELNRRRWTQKHLANVLKRPEQMVSDMPTDEFTMTPGSARELRVLVARARDALARVTP
jgi:plasmid maintenance system antidote protein VapI